MSDNKTENPALDLLVGKRRFSREEWCTLITHRLDCLRPYLDNFSLETMGENLFVPYAISVKLGELRKKEIPFDGWTNGILKNQGLFFASPRCDWEQWNYEKERIEMPLWGLLRNGLLVSMILYLNIKDHRVDGDRHSGSVGDVIRVVIEEIDVATILSYYPDSHCNSERIGPWYLWWQLGKQVEEFASRRYYIYQDAQKLKKQFELETMLLERTGAQHPEKKETEEIVSS